MKKQLITALIPAYNEEECIYELYNRVTSVLKNLKNYDYEILIINDGSKDNTLQEIRALHEKDSRVKCVSFSRNFGKEAALFAGIRNVTGD